MAATTEVVLMAPDRIDLSPCAGGHDRFLLERSPGDEIGARYLRYASWGFVFSGFVFSCSGVFQGMGNTWPGLLISATNLLIFAITAVWMSSPARISPSAIVGIVGYHAGITGGAQLPARAHADE